MALGVAATRSKVIAFVNHIEGDEVATDGQSTLSDWQAAAVWNGAKAVERWRGRGRQHWEVRGVTTSSCMAEGRTEPQRQLQALVSWQTSPGTGRATEAHSAAAAAAWRYPRHRSGDDNARARGRERVEVE